MGTAAEQGERNAASPREISQTARSLLARHSHFRGRVESFEFVVEGRMLLVRGSVPSFYLKQVLQTVLKQVTGIQRIDNQVDVVSADGLSSVRRR